MPDTPLPPPDDSAHPVTLNGTKALGPDGQPFAIVWKTGFFTKGNTMLGTWLDTKPGIDLPSSAIAVVRAVSHNEGRLEAVNSYDNCFLSFGLFQWTSGPNAEAGELPGLLTRLKADSPEDFADCFGRYKLDAQMQGGSGYLTLDGVALKSPAQKAPLRSKEWAYRFWRAGHSAGVRAAQCKLAAGRLNTFINTVIEGFALKAWFSSEYAIALVLDEHVNRPGHVPKTLISAIATLDSAKKQDPTGWSDTDEHGLIVDYLAKREATNMTDPNKRALAIATAMHAGELSPARGSFNM